MQDTERAEFIGIMTEIISEAGWKISPELQTRVYEFLKEKRNLQCQRLIPKLENLRYSSLSLQSPPVRIGKECFERLSIVKKLPPPKSFLERAFKFGVDLVSD